MMAFIECPRVVTGTHVRKNPLDVVKSAPVQERVTLYSWIVAVLCLATYAVSFFCRNAWSTAIPIAAPALNLSMTAAGGLMTAFYAGYVASNFLTGSIVDSIGPRKVLAATSLLTGLFTIVIPFASNYPVIFLLRVGAGIAAGPLFAGVVKYQLAWFTRGLRATAMGFIMSGVVVGDMISTGVFAPIIQTKGWRTGFTYAGAAGIVLAVIFYIFAKERGPVLPGTVKKEEGTEKKQGSRADLLAVLTQRSFLIGTLVHFLNMGAGQGLTTYLLVYLTKTQGLSLANAGGLLAGATSVGLVSGTLSGITSDLIGSRKKACYVGAAGAAMGTIALLYTANPAMFAVVYALRRLVSSLMGTPLNTLQAETAAGPYAGRAMGFYNGCAHLGSVLGPLATGFVLDLTGNNFFYVLTAIAAIQMTCGLLVILMTETAAGRIEKTPAPVLVRR